MVGTCSRYINAKIVVQCCSSMQGKTGADDFFFVVDYRDRRQPYNQLQCIQNSHHIFHVFVHLVSVHQINNIIVSCSP